MSDKRNLDFSDKKLFIGLDIHKKNWAVTIRCLGMELSTFSMNPSPVELYRHLQKRYPNGQYFSAYEAGFCGYWIHRQLEQLGVRNIVFHAADVPTTHKEREKKNDKIDSRKIARELENNSLIGNYIPDEKFQQFRSLRRLRDRTAQNQTRTKNRIKGLLNFLGVKMPSQQEMPHWSSRFLSWLETVELSHSSSRDYLDLCLLELQEHRKRTSEIVRLLRKYCKELGLYQLLLNLRTVPGIGFVTAITLISEIMDMTRFSKFDHLASFFGLTPSVVSSGDKEANFGLTNRRNRYLRHVIIEAAWVAIRKDPALLCAFDELSRRMKKQDAIIRIAKKLLNRVRYVWNHQQEYVTGVAQ
jgi:transposase